MIFLVILILLLILAPLLAVRHNRVQSTTLYLGKYLAKKDIGEDYATLMSPRGLQDAITPRSQKWYLYTMLSSWVIIIVVSFLVAWYWIIISFIVYFIMYALYDRVINNKQLKYATLLMIDLANRSADYKKANDLDRSEAAADFGHEIEDYMNSIRKENPDLPNPKDIM